MVDINLVNLFKIHEKYGHDKNTFVCSCFCVSSWGDYEEAIKAINNSGLYTLQDVVDSKIESGDLSGIFFFISKLDNPKQTLDVLFNKRPTLLMSPQFKAAMSDIYEEYSDKRAALKKDLIDRYIGG